MKTLGETNIKQVPWTSCKGALLQQGPAHQNPKLISSADSTISILIDLACAGPGVAAGRALAAAAPYTHAA